MLIHKFFCKFSYSIILFYFLKSTFYKSAELFGLLLGSLSMIHRMCSFNKYVLLLGQLFFLNMSIFSLF